jgi:hypothetical protein
VALIGILSIGRFMGYRDEDVAMDHKLPPAREFHEYFKALLPWFADVYNETRVRRARESWYTGPLAPCTHEDSHNRLRYMYAIPARTKQGIPRQYCLSNEHPLSVEQALPGKLREVYERCASIIDERLRQDPIKPVTREEALEWGRLLEPMA